MALNSLGTEKRTPIAAPVTLPKLVFRESDIEAEIREAARIVSERKIVRAGRDCWEAMNRTESYEAWLKISAALAIGKAVALRSSGANSANGSRYTAALSGWIKQNFGGRPMRKQTRYWCLQLNEHLPEIEGWRATLPERQRQKLVNPLSVVRRWQRATSQLKSRCTDDMQRAAALAWRRFVSCVEALPPDQAMPLWRDVQTQAALKVNSVAIS